MHLAGEQRDTAASFPLPAIDDIHERRLANRAVGVSAAGLAVTGLIELGLAILSGSVGLLADALHNLSDVSTSLLVFVGFRVSRRPPNNRYPYGYEKAEDMAGIGIALVIWASAAFAAVQSIDKLIHHGDTRYAASGAAGAAIGIVGNQIVARYKKRIGVQINSNTMIADAKHSWLDALSSAGALIGLLGVLAGVRWADPVAGLVVTGFICHVGWEVTTDVTHRLLDGVDPDIITTAENVAWAIPGIAHAHARARWTGRTLRVEVKAWVSGQTTVAEANLIGQATADLLAAELPYMRSFGWSARSDGPRPAGP